MNEENKGGLVELPEDKRDLQLGALYRLPDLEELPSEYELPILAIKNQGNTDFCSAYASCGMSEIQEGVELYPEYSFAISKSITGDPKKWGQDMRSAMKAHQKYGALEMKETAMNAFDIKWDDLRYLDKYPESYLQEALKHRKKSYFKVSGQYDPYDDIKAAIWKFKGQKQAVAIGLVFSWPINQYLLDTIQTSGFGHMMYIIGWNEEGLVVVNSYGTNAGKKGKHIITREVINYFAGKYGAMMMVDISPEEARKQISRRNWYFARWWSKIIIYIKNLFT